MRVLTAFRISARFIVVWPTMAVKGKRGSPPFVLSLLKDCSVLVVMRFLN